MTHSVAREAGFARHIAELDKQIAELRAEQERVQSHSRLIAEHCQEQLRIEAQLRLEVSKSKRAHAALQKSVEAKLCQRKKTSTPASEDSEGTPKLRERVLSWLKDGQSHT